MWEKSNKELVDVSDIVSRLLIEVRKFAHPGTSCMQKHTMYNEWTYKRCSVCRLCKQTKYKTEYRAIT